MNKFTKRNKKKINQLDILMVSFGAMIGWGWVVSSGTWLRDAGVLGTILGFLLGGLMIYFIGLIYAELSTSIVSGGCLAYSKKAMGPNISFLCSWMMILGYVGVVCFEACSLPTIVAYIFPSFLQGYLYTIAGFDIYATWLFTAIGFAIFITVINILGLKTAAIFQNILTLIIAVIGIILIISSSIKGNANNILDNLFNGSNSFMNFKGILSVAAVAPFFLFGFEVIPETMTEIKIDLKKTGRVMMFSIFLAVSFYALISFSIGYSLSKNEILTSISGSGLVAADAMKKIFNSEIMADVLIIGGICGIITSWNSFLIGGSRALTSLSENQMISKIFSQRSKRFDTPFVSIILVGFISICAPFFGKNMLEWISNVSSFACIFTYFIVSVSFIVIRKKYPYINRPYKIKYGLTVAFLGTIMSLVFLLLFLIPNSGATFGIEEFVILCIWLFTGFIFYLFGRFKFKSDFGLGIERSN